MDRIQATPRVNPTIGDLADMLGGTLDYLRSPQRTQQMQGLINALPFLDDAQVLLDRISYGEPITTGRGMTTELRDEAKSTLGALLGLVPIGRAAAPAAEAATMAAGRAGERVASRVVPQVMERGGLPAEMLGAMAQGTQSPATVFHGTPHLFRQFDSSKIGTGEGAQAFGHGLYLAENPGVAKDYQQKLSSAGSAKNLASQFGGIDEGLAEAQRRVDRYKEMVAQGDGNSERAKSFLRISEKNLQDLQAMKQGLPENTGYLYQVDLPDEQIARMLDYDKPLSQQPKSIQDFALQNSKELVRSVKFQQANPLNENFAPKSIYDLTGRELYSALQRTDRKQKELFKQRDALVAKYQGKGMSMADAVRAMNADDRAKFSQIADEVEALKNAPAAASEMLRQAGIPGIRYLDEGSRGAGQGTSNFVVFPGMEDMLRIEQINNQPIESLFQNLGR
jgi:hypothetical protein